MKRKYPACEKCLCLFCKDTACKGETQECENCCGWAVRGAEMPNKTDDELLEMMRFEQEKLQSLHPFTQPGLWDLAVDNIRAIRAVIEIHQNQKTAKRLSC